MTEIQVLDEGGDPMTMIDLGHCRSSTFGRSVEYIRDLNEKLPNFQFRDGDILLLSYPKAGCNWTFEILSMLLKGNTEAPVYNKMDVMLEATTQDNIDAIQSPRLLNTHLPYRRLPRSVCDNKVKIVFVVRNPKDSAVSFYNMMTGLSHYTYDGKFSNWLPLYLRGDMAFDSYTRHLREYEEAFKSNLHDVIILYYEDMKKNTIEEIKRLVDFLQLSPSPDFLKEITAKCQFREMKTRHTEPEMAGSVYKNGKKYGFMRKGEVGDWKKWFTVAQSEMMDDVLKTQMKDSMFKFTYQL